MTALNGLTPYNKRANLFKFKDNLGAIHKGHPDKTRIVRPPSPLRPDKTIESHSNNN